MGLDLRENMLHSYDADERVDAAMLPIVFIGKVLIIEDTPCAISEPFHSKVSVQIIDLLKGPKQRVNTIQLLRQSGAVLNYGNTKRIASTMEPTLTVGDTSVFYLDKIDDDPYLTTVYKSSTFQKENR